MRTDPGTGRALLAAVVVGLLWAQGGALRTIAGLFLIVALATPGPDGKSLLQVSVEQVQSMLGFWTSKGG
jgi:hypothetical protein